MEKTTEFRLVQLLVSLLIILRPVFKLCVVLCCFCCSNKSKFVSHYNMIIKHVVLVLQICIPKNLQQKHVEGYFYILRH